MSFIMSEKVGHTSWTKGLLPKTYATTESCGVFDDAGCRMALRYWMNFASVSSGWVPKLTENLVARGSRSDHSRSDFFFSKKETLIARFNVSRVRGRGICGVINDVQ